MHMNTGMLDFLFRFAILLLVGLGMYLLLLAGQRLVARKRQRALSAEPLKRATQAATGKGTSAARVHILAFSSEDCHQCHTLQMPVLRRVVEARGDAVFVEEVDAPSSPELTRRYQVLTVPTTVLLDASGKAHAVNYGFTNAMSLLQQVDEILEQDGVKIH
jgi:Thioredoxin